MLGAGVFARAERGLGCEALVRCPSGHKEYLFPAVAGELGVGWGEATASQPSLRTIFSELRGSQGLERLLSPHCLLHRLHLSPEAP